MKRRMSMNERQRFDLAICAGYCDLQDIFRELQPTGYNAGIYGWNCDIFEVYMPHASVFISTGYRNMKGPMIEREDLQKAKAKLNALGDVSRLERRTAELEIVEDWYAKYSR